MGGRKRVLLIAFEAIGLLVSGTLGVVFLVRNEWLLGAVLLLGAGTFGLNLFLAVRSPAA